MRGGTLQVERGQRFVNGYDGLRLWRKGGREIE